VKKKAKGRATRSVKNLSAKTLSANQAKGVKGGSLMKGCATGKHIAKAVLCVR
jgi:hypothetical protein